MLHTALLLWRLFCLFAASLGRWPSCLLTIPPLLPLQQKARDNRAALRINKVQLSNDTLKRQQQQVPDPFDPSVPLETEVIFKDPLKHKESEHEQEWKFRQVTRQLLGMGRGAGWCFESVCFV